MNTHEKDSFLKELTNDKSIKKYINLYNIIPFKIDDDLNNLLKENIIQHKKRINNFNDPNCDNKYALISFMFGDDNIFYKVRGCGNLNDMKMLSVEIIKNIDSVTKIIIIELGAWKLLTPNTEEYSDFNHKVVDDENNPKVKKLMLDMKREKTRDEKDILKNFEKRTEMLLNDIEEDVDISDFIGLIESYYQNKTQIDLIENLACILKEKVKLIQEKVKYMLPNYEKTWWNVYVEKMTKIGVSNPYLKKEFIENFKSEDISEIKNNDELNEINDRISQLNIDYTNKNFKTTH